MALSFKEATRQACEIAYQQFVLGKLKPTPIDRSEIDSRIQDIKSRAETIRSEFEVLKNKVELEANAIKMRRFDGRFDGSQIIRLGLFCPKCGDFDNGNKMGKTPYCLKCNVPLVTKLPKKKEVEIKFKKKSVHQSMEV